ncbi:MAG: hydrogenase formation protein HypD [Deltaproteobacteria bacterium]
MLKRDSDKEEVVIQHINNMIERNADRNISLMEVCGTHTVSIFKHGIRSMLPENIKLISGPGCPVCVTPTEYLDQAQALAEKANVVICTFGDMLRVPGSNKTLEDSRVDGADIRVVYSPLDCIDIAIKNPGKKVVFLAVGFETTAPVIALTIKHAENKNMKNFFILSGLKTIFPAVRKVLDYKNLNIDGLICPGHVTSITGERAYDFIPDIFGIPCAVAGFEALDILRAVEVLISKVLSAGAGVWNVYKRAGTIEGNLKAQELISEVFERTDDSWRGFGEIESSGFKLAGSYKRFDIRDFFGMEAPKWQGDNECLCGDIVRGVKEPYQCMLFGKACTPQAPKGPCMVSGEGTCATYFKFGKYK